ncbi:GNAT family N-acetyltransferase [Actinoallomurus sp. NBC_01490]|uniref:GNAT family N-acetyltransferase n=1 Tax=Actinoallomurus sp. NBC_01490 TaxID=2903557 RepID=UPI002E3605CD|nr:GNAT family N-acetyltransferase [Actinoallomurus sp. NBC_01490]
METHTLEPGDLDAVHDLWDRAFGPSPGRDDAWALRAMGEDRFLGVRDGGRLIAVGHYHPFEQWWHGRAVPMGGVGGVCVAPEDRGRGVGRRLAAGLLELMDGRPLSALYPATAPVYRSVGYEHAGAQYRLTLPPAPLRTLAAGPVEVRRAGPADVGEVTALLRRLHAGARHHGPIDPGEDQVRRFLQDERLYSYLAADGFLAYGWDEGREHLAVRRCVAGSATTARALWAVVGSGSSIARTVRANVAPDDPMLWLLHDRSEDELRRVGWMLRVLDAPAAIAARGFPVAVSVDVPLLVEDELRPANAGGWRLTVREGRGRLERAAERRDATRLPARGLAALYAGVPMATLRGAGIVTGNAGADPLLDAAFAGTPFMLDYF